MHDNYVRKRRKGVVYLPTRGIENFCNGRDLKLGDRIRYNYNDIGEISTILINSSNRNDYIIYANNNEDIIFDIKSIRFFE